ncbi:unnamed protein product [Prunus armeniaca]|uniref:Uncharacterized protein n=1 Tax=Prunus armeniaca TaxID=36596 RepID=A0A6J5XBN8_PRUAR|nr:unnamed protein product [Prunus armeniaca]CAB4310017.1 unnamed protein product [Prunus armeniaca]
MGLSDLDGEVALDDIECSLGSCMVLTHRAKVGVVIGISAASRRWCALGMEEIPIGSGTHRVLGSNGGRFGGKTGASTGIPDF